MDLQALDLESFKVVAIAAGLGTIVGLEREVARKPAGLRTHIFVCAGSALLMLLGHGVVDRFQESETTDVLSADPIRVLQAIVVGISFLGAGTIVHDKANQVEGLTTAATIYLTAGIGVAVAIDRVWLAVETTLFAVVILVLVGWLERQFGKDKNSNSDNPHPDA